MWLYTMTWRSSKELNYKVIIPPTVVGKVIFYFIDTPMFHFKWPLQSSTSKIREFFKTLSWVELPGVREYAGVSDSCWILILLKQWKLKETLLETIISAMCQIHFLTIGNKREILSFKSSALCEWPIRFFFILQNVGYSWFIPYRWVDGM